MGDVTFLHDANGLVLGPDEPRPDLTIVVVNDDGGSIFAMLEQGAPEHAEPYDRLFGTPHGVDLAALCAATRTPHWRVDVARPSSSTRWPARTAGSRSSRSSYAATTGATSTPGSAPCGPESGPRWPRRRRPPGCWEDDPVEIALLLVALAVGVLALSALAARLGLPGAAAADRGRRRGVVPPGRAGAAPRARGGAASGCCRRCCTPTAIQSSLVDFNANRRPILLLSVGLVVFTTVGVGVVVHTILPAIELAVGVRDRRGRRPAGRRRGHRDRPPDRAAAADRHDPRGRVAAQRRHRAGRAAHRHRGHRGRRRPRWTPGGSAADFVWAAVGGDPASASVVFVAGRLDAPAGRRPGARHRHLVRDPVRRLPRGRGDPRLRHHRASWSPACCSATRRRSCRPRSRGSRSG